ncbi:MAG: glutamate 5-kinase [Actinomycetaceae bacterium]|nr:glutamate 5-kinase [Actinomycetaceae bacterium]
MKEALTDRVQIRQAERVVVKVGSSSLTLPDGTLDTDAIARLAQALIGARERGQEVILVSSGSMAAGMNAVGLTGRPKDIPLHQAASMVGQSRLIAAYQAEFAKADITVGQVLLTATDVMNRRHYANAQESLLLLLSYGIIPIVNENDAVITEELRFGDNDRLAALTSHLVAADALILLTDVDGLYTAPPSHEPEASLISTVHSFDELEQYEITGRGSVVGTGGMATKVAAADLACSGGVGVLLTSTHNVERALAGEEVGTWFVPTRPRSSARQLWLAHAAQSRGTVIIDSGAVRALLSHGASLLPVGVIAVAGRFRVGDLVDIQSVDGQHIGRGLTAFSSGDLSRIAADKEAARGLRPVVHANDLVRSYRTGIGNDN